MKKLIIILFGLIGVVYGQTVKVSPGITVLAASDTVPMLQRYRDTLYSHKYLIGANTTAISTKQGTITLTTTGTSGASTLIGNTLNIPAYAASGSGTVTAVSVATVNGFAGTSSGGTTPIITLTTPITGILKGNGTAISAATAGTDYGRVDSVRLVNSGLIHTPIATFALSGNTAVITQTLASQTANMVLAGPGSGAAATPTFRALVPLDIPNITESQVTNLTSDLALKAPLASPALTGVPTSPTATVGTNTTQIATTAFVAAANTSSVLGKQDTLNVYLPEKYGAVGDGVTNDAAAFTAMIAAMNLRGGKVILQAKSYLINTTVTINKPIWFEGQGMGDSTILNGATRIITTSGTIVVFDVKEDHCQFSNLAFYNNSATAPTAGTALGFTGNTRTGSFVWGFNLDKVYISGFYDAILATNALEWGISGCYFKAPVRYGIYIACTSAPDGGDSYISNCEFIPRIGNSVAGIFQQSSGGLKISGCKFNGGTGVKFIRSYLGVITASTVDLLFTGNSFENYSQNAISISKTSTFFRNVSIVGNQFAGYASVGSDINASGIENITVIGNTFDVATADTAVFLSSVIYASINNTYRGYTNPVITNSCTNVTNISNKKIAIDNTDASGTTVFNLTAGTAGFLATAYGQSFGASGLANRAAFGPGTSTTAGVAIFSNGAAASGSTGYISLRGGGYDVAAEKIYIDKNGVGIGTQAPTALLHLAAGTAAAGTAPLKFTAGVNLTTPVSGTVEFDGTNFSGTSGATRYTLQKTSSGGSNANVGTATLVAGTVTVSTTAALTASLIYVTVKTPGGTQGFLSVPTITNATSFVINSTSATETSTVNYWIIN